MFNVSRERKKKDPYVKANLSEDDECKKEWTTTYEEVHGTY